MSKDKNDYLGMQKSYYDEYASIWSLNFRDPVVGSYDAHNNWEDYDTVLFSGIETEGMTAIEYGCGPGRNLVKFNDRFSQIDGVDISQINLDKAKLNLEHNGIYNSELFHTSGDNFGDAPDDSYDVVFAVICLQHICSYTIRRSIFIDALRVLKSGGHFCFQMGYGGKDGIDTADYFDDAFDAMSTNGHSDVSITDADVMREDLESLGYTWVSHSIRETGPGDTHRNWIWVQVKK